jgi:hypothetical protein
VAATLRIPPIVNAKRRPKRSDIGPLVNEHSIDPTWTKEFHKESQRAGRISLLAYIEPKEILEDGSVRWMKK